MIIVKDSINIFESFLVAGSSIILKDKEVAALEDENETAWTLDIFYPCRNHGNCRDLERGVNSNSRNQFNL